MKVETAVKMIEETGVKNKLRTDKVKRVSSETSCFRQGDIYMFRVSNNHPVGKRVVRNQIADGFSVGARHILVGGFKVYSGIELPVGVDRQRSSVALGYAIDVDKDCILTHPEHDRYLFETPGRWQVVHQIDQRTLQRVRD